MKKAAAENPAEHEPIEEEKALEKNRAPSPEEIAQFRELGYVGADLECGNWCVYSHAARAYRLRRVSGVLARWDSHRVREHRYVGADMGCGDWGVHTHAAMAYKPRRIGGVLAQWDVHRVRGPR